MKIKTEKQKLVSILAAAQSITKGRSTLPVLSCVILEASSDKEAKDIVKVLATDGESFLAQRCDSANTDYGSVALPAKKLLDIVRSLDSNDVTISVEESKATIKGGNASFSLMGYDSAEFPPTPFVDTKKSFSVPCHDLSRLIGNTIFSVCKDTSRPVLAGISCNVKGKNVTFASSDGKRLSKDSVTLDSEQVETKSIIPSQIANELLRFLTTGSSATVSIQDNLIQFIIDGGATVFIANLLDLTFPDINNVIPNSFDIKIQINRESLLSILRRAQIVATEKAESVKMLWSKNNLNISANSIAVGDINEDLDIEYKGSTLGICFSPSYFIEALSVLDKKEVTLCFNDENSPMMIEADNFRHILMPMRISQLC